MKIAPVRKAAFEKRRDEDEDDGLIPGETVSQTA